MNLAKTDYKDAEQRERDLSCNTQEGAIPWWGMSNHLAEKPEVK